MGSLGGKPHRDRTGDARASVVPLKEGLRPILPRVDRQRLAQQLQGLVVLAEAEEHARVHAADLAPLCAELSVRHEHRRRRDAQLLLGRLELLLLQAHLAEGGGGVRLQQGVQQDER